MTSITLIAFAYAVLLTIVNFYIIFTDIESNWRDKIIDTLLSLIFFALILGVYVNTLNNVIDNNLSDKLLIALTIFLTLTPIARKTINKYKYLSNKNKILLDCIYIREQYDYICQLDTLYVKNIDNDISKKVSDVSQNSYKITELSSTLYGAFTELASIYLELQKYLICNKKRELYISAIMQASGSRKVFGVDIHAKTQLAFSSLILIIKMLDNINEKDTATRLLNNLTDYKLKTDLNDERNKPTSSK